MCDIVPENLHTHYMEEKKLVAVPTERGDNLNCLEMKGAAYRIVLQVRCRLCLFLQSVLQLLCAHWQELYQDDVRGSKA
jgi:hypothetical protein